MVCGNKGGGRDTHQFILPTVLAQAVSNASDHILPLPKLNQSDVLDINFMLKFIMESVKSVDVFLRRVEKCLEIFVRMSMDFNFDGL